MSKFQSLVKPLHNYHYFSLLEYEKAFNVSLRHLPYCIRIILESLIRNFDGIKITEKDIHNLSHWQPGSNKGIEVPFIVARVLLQDFTGVPLLVDLATMRDAVAERGFDASLIEPKVPVDLVIDHSVQVDKSATDQALEFNLNMEFERNIERYEFLKWGQQAFKTFSVTPPGVGIVHQVNLEYTADVVTERLIEDKIFLFPDTLVGTDSHTTMINGLGVIGWGVGGIEAEASMLGQPLSLQAPEVIGFHLKGKLPEGSTATDLALRVTEILRKENVVDKFIEFFGEGTASLSVADRSTIANMAPEYGATVGYFPVDEKTLEYLIITGRSAKKIDLIRDYLKAQDLFGVKMQGEIRYTQEIELDLSTVQSCVAGPKRPQDRIDLSQVKKNFQSLLATPTAQGGYGKNEQEIHKSSRITLSGVCQDDDHKDSGGLEYNPPGAPRDVVEMVANRPYTCAVAGPGYSENKSLQATLRHGSIVIAAITSCTNTSNPSVMIAAGLLAKKAVEHGLKAASHVKTSLAPGSRVVSDYLQLSGLQPYLDTLGFHVVGYGCTTCIGNSGPLDSTIENTIRDYDLVTASVLSGNRNFEARIHSSVKANYLMSPPLVVAYTLAGRIDIDLLTEPLGISNSGKAVYLKDLWPSSEEIAQASKQYLTPDMYKKRYAALSTATEQWTKIPSSTGNLYNWNAKSTYIRRPPYFDEFSPSPKPVTRFENMHCIALLGDSVTTDHISPAGSFKATTPAGIYLSRHGINEQHFNSYGSRRGNHEVMMRGTFANVRIKNLMAIGKEGGFTKHIPSGRITTIFDAATEYSKNNTPLILFAGKDYGMGSSRDWAAKGTNLLGIKIVVAQSFERIHRSNLIGMGILPLEFLPSKSYSDYEVTGEETFSLKEITSFEPGQIVELEAISDNSIKRIPLKLRLDTSLEMDYYRHGGILPYVLRQLMHSHDG